MQKCLPFRVRLNIPTVCFLSCKYYLWKYHLSFLTMSLLRDFSNGVALEKAGYVICMSFNYAHSFIHSFKIHRFITDDFPLQNWYKLFPSSICPITLLWLTDFMQITLSTVVWILPGNSFENSHHNCQLLNHWYWVKFMQDFTYHDL